VDVGLVIKQRLEELRLEQKDLAIAAGVTDSYISQLLSGKKLPPAPGRTDLYVKMGKFLKLPARKLSEMAGHQRIEELKKKLDHSPAPLFKEVRDVVLSKCARSKQKEIRSIFERQPFGELERLVTQKLLDVVKRVAKEELQSDGWLKRVAQLNGRSYEQMRDIVFEFLDVDVFHVSAEHCTTFLSPLIDSWDIDLANFGMEIVLNRRLAPDYLRKLEFVEMDSNGLFEEEPGFKEFARNRALSGDASEEEIAFLRKMQFAGKRPTALYYYRELQNLRDPLNFRARSVSPMSKYGDAYVIEKEIQLHARKGAIQRWTTNKPHRTLNAQKSKRVRSKLASLRRKR
jgi:transcriptional regulator with XRE-family HTH domain